MTSTTEKKESLFFRLTHKLRKQNTKPQTITLPPKPFEKYKKKQESNPSVSHSSISGTPSSRRITYGRKLRIPHLRTFKRYTAGLLLLINGLLFILTLSAPTTASSSQTLLIFFFFGNTLIILDYIWKTSSWRITKKT